MGNTCSTSLSWTWGLRAAVASPLWGCSRTAYAFPFSSSCKGGDFSVPVDVTCGSYMSSSTARKKTAEDFPSRGESSATWQAGAFRCPPPLCAGSTPRGGSSSVPSQPLTASKAHVWEWKGNFSEVRQQQTCFFTPYRTDANQHLCCKGSFHFLLTFQCFLLVFIT